MKREEIKQKIRETALNEMPDIIEKINLDNIVIEPKETTSFPWQRSFKWAVSLFVLVLVGFFSFQLFIQQPSTEPFSTDVELLAFQTVSAQSLIEYSENQVETLSLNLINDHGMMNTDAEDVEDYLDDMSPLIELAELLINQRDQIQFTEMTSDWDEYQYRIRFSAINLLDETIDYDIYYNEMDHQAEGIIVKNDQTYDFNQNLERLRLFIDDDTYIDVEEERSQNIHQFNFRMMRQQTEVLSTKIDMILENSEYKANFEYNNRMGMIIQMQISRNKDQSMGVDYEIRDNARALNGRFDVSVQEDEMGGPPFYRFKFDDESEADSNRPGHNPRGHGDDQPGPGYQQPGPPF